MRIIREGKKITAKQVTTTCSDCDTEFEFGAGEGKYISDPRDGDAIVIKCPMCGHTIWVTVSLFK